MKSTIAAVLLDLDGTLLDTAPDLATALNVVLQQRGHPPLPFHLIRPWCSEGSKGLLGLGFHIDDKHPDFPQLRTDFLQAYHHHLIEKTAVFPGMVEVLNYLVARRVPWGIVTNKPIALAEELLNAFDLPDYKCLIGGDSLAKRKPEPEPLLHACAQLGYTPEKCVYIGDSQRDIEAAKRAQMLAVAALYGYRTSEDHPGRWQADFYIDSPHDIIPLLEILLGELSPHIL
ncbi:MAG: HAD-IA family hydrolase [Gammaproteobacteria bacterium]